MAEVRREFLARWRTVYCVMSESVLTRPSLLLRAEGGIVFGASLLAYGEAGASWVVFVVLVLVPDLSMLGYFSGVRFGAALYNLVHMWRPCFSSAFRSFTSSSGCCLMG